MYLIKTDRSGLDEELWHSIFDNYLDSPMYNVVHNYMIITVK